MIKRLMKNYAVSEKGARGMINAVAATVCLNVALMLPVGLMYMLVSDMLYGQPFRHSATLGAGIVGVFVLLYIAIYWQYNATFFSTYKESGEKRVALAEKLRMLPLSYFGRKDSADLTTVLLGDVEKLEHTISHQFAQFYGAIISTVIVGAGLFFLDWRMALAALWMLPISIAIVLCSRGIQNHFSRIVNKASLESADGIQECIEASRDLKAANAEKRYLDGLFRKIDAVESTLTRSELTTGLLVSSAQMLLKTGMATVVLVGSGLLIKGEADVITFFAFMLVISRIYEPMNGSLINLAAINSLQVSVERMNEITEYPAQEGSNELTNNGYDIEFSHVKFAYDNGEQVLRDVSFTAKQGEVTALIGPSGGGKTTVSRLAARFWDVTGGRITVGGMDISRVEPETLLKLYSIVFQDVTLFDNTIMENIRVGKKDATDEEVVAAARLANVDEFAKRLTDGYSTRIGENGSELSGGERQRISIARAFLKDAPIILLDEATASLDAENESLVQEALSKLIADKTVMIIAHRMRTVANADHIVVLKDGVTAEQGSPDELYASGDIYRRMSDLQKESSEWQLK
ncbi:MAG: ABC transporter ATP-binding protein/permease [Firmicutes bacterium]|nr:ABC transporter ATP-binding protein/permease [Bacillota bacterium]